MSPHQGCDERDGGTWGRFLRRLGFRWQPSPAALERVGPYYFLDHTHSKAFLETAELATVAPSLVYRARLVGKTHVFGSLLHGPLEKTFATFTGPNPVVLAGSGVSAHGAQLRRGLGRGSNARSGHCAPRTGGRGCCWGGRRCCNCRGYHVAQSAAARGRRRGR